MARFSLTLALTLTLTLTLTPNEDRPLVLSIVRTLATSLRVPVLCEG